MKTKIIVSVIVVLTWAVSNSRSQEFTLTTTSPNTVSSMAKIEVPALTGNPQAIIVATRSRRDGRINTHRIGALERVNRRQK